MDWSSAGCNRAGLELGVGIGWIRVGWCGVGAIQWDRKGWVG